MDNSSREGKVTPARAKFWMVATTMLWGGSFVFNKIGFREIHPVTFLFIRFSMATVLMGMLSIGRFSAFSGKILRNGIIVGGALAAANFTFVLGVSGTTVSRAGFLNNLFVLFVPLICLVLWNDKVSRVTFAGLSLAVAGLFLLARGGLEGFNRGDLLSTVCAFFIALQIIAVSKVLRDEDVYLVTLVQFATVTLVGGALSFFFAPPIQPFGFVSVGSLLYCAVFPTVICFTLQNTYQRYTTPAQAGLIYTLDPIWSMIGGFLLLGERLSMAEWAGCALIFLGVALPIGIGRLVERRYLPSA
jgi:drug/metabolite transporter (DMT)-like permease